MTGRKAPFNRHWSEIEDFEYGDIKLIWEPNRFGFVYALVRAYLRTGEERYPELFWQLVEDWRRHNPPNYGQIDGALIQPLSNCEYRDYRPAIQLAHYLLTGARCYPDGPWDEDLLWLLGSASLQTPIVQIKRSDLQAEAGGYYTLRTNGAGWVYLSFWK